MSPRRKAVVESNDPVHGPDSVIDDEYGDPGDSEWQPIPLEFPLDDPYRRPPAPAGGVEMPDPDDAPRRVIVIDLA